MSNTETQDRGSSKIERYLQHVVQALTVTAIIGGVVAVSDMRTSAAVIATRLHALEMRISELKDGANDRYTGTQAAKDFKTVYDRLTDHEGRLRELERRTN